MKFYMTPGSCTTGIHILLEELELVFEVHLVNLLNGDNHDKDYLAINPKGTIPALVTKDGTALTDYQSIAYWLATSYPKAKLIPEEPTEAALVIEKMNYAVSTIHGEGFTRIFTTNKYSDNPQEYDTIKQQGKAIINNAFLIMDKALENKDYIENSFTIADSALFYVEFWANKTDIPLPPNCRRHYQTMLQRDAVRRVLREEGYRV